MVRSLLFIVLVALCCPPRSHAQTEENENPLSVLSGFVGTTWKAEVTPAGAIEKVHDISRWDWTLDGRAIRIRHGLDNGSYSGEALVTWDHRAQTIAYLYATTGDFFSRGSMRADSVFYDTMETVVGGANGVVAVRSTGELLTDGSLMVISLSRTRQGWTEPDTTRYWAAPDTEDIPSAGSPK